MLKTESNSGHDARKPTDADRYVGQQLRQGRREASLTQDGLAQMLGVTFQQIQKYEAGHSRMSAGRLREVAIALKKPISFFYEPFEPIGRRSEASATRLRIKDLRRDAKKLLDQITDPDDLAVAVRLLNALETDGN
ncbi:helix-turn-helix domain-containing protein [Hyphomonas johnsonii]|jgi:transcriptional regulator with XRE-family HTH domain|uniref:Transcriptional regulator n=1 Tax=Hyphomonas johnsonii MHS-2 TaxID=1280950 RepID=A0A059FHB6_9PROT|nr:helix-turn-helix transcriptional regulator [Hyphomonas johnsonii]KCZ90015.1 transcriptional regulator [Hyphomonas johnsonii MHS-2]